MMEPNLRGLSVGKQYALLSISRSSFCYEPKGESEINLDLMRLMPIYQKPNTGKTAKGRKIHPYLLRGLGVDWPNQVWCANITSLTMRRDFLDLAAIMDWHARKVPAWASR